jgi:hypothetical protein
MLMMLISHHAMVWKVWMFDIHIVSVDCVAAMWSWKLHDVDGKMLMM